MTNNPIYPNILHLEDEEFAVEFQKLAQKQDLGLTHIAETGEDAIDYFNIHWRELDAVIVDLRGDPDSSGGTKSWKGANQIISQVQHKDPYFPLIVLTAQADKERLEDLTLDSEKIFNKVKALDAIAHLKRRIANRDKSAVRGKYSDILEFCTDKNGIGRDAWDALFEPLLEIESNGSATPFDAKKLKPFRDIFGLLARAYEKKGLFPTELCNPRVNLTSFMHFLKGNCEGYSQIGYPPLPGLFSANLIHFYVKVLQAASHLDANGEDVLDPKVEAEIGEYNHKAGDRNHLLQTITYLTIDLLRIAKGIFEDERYSDPEKNKKLWTKTSSNTNSTGETYNGSFIKDRGPHGTFTSECGKIVAIIFKEIIPSDGGRLEGVTIEKSKQSKKGDLEYKVVGFKS